MIIVYHVLSVSLGYCIYLMTGLLKWSYVSYKVPFYHFMALKSFYRHTLSVFYKRVLKFRHYFFTILKSIFNNNYFLINAS